MNGARRVYDALVRSPVSNAIVLGLLGVGAFCFGVADYLKESKPWPGGVTLGAMAIICAAQGLTGASRIEVKCSWRILLTFFDLYIVMDILTRGPGGTVTAVLKGAAVIVMAYICSKVWRSSYMES